VGPIQDRYHFEGRASVSGALTRLRVPPSVRARLASKMGADASMHAVRSVLLVTTSDAPSHMVLIRTSPEPPTIPLSLSL
jgi:hypothetical protein